MRGGYLRSNGRPRSFLRLGMVPTQFVDAPQLAGRHTLIRSKRHPIVCPGISLWDYGPSPHIGHKHPPRNMDRAILWTDAVGSSVPLVRTHPVFQATCRHYAKRVAVAQLIAHHDRVDNAVRDARYKAVFDHSTNNGSLIPNTVKDCDLYGQPISKNGSQRSMVLDVGREGKGIGRVIPIVVGKDVNVLALIELPDLPANASP